MVNAIIIWMCAHPLEFVGSLVLFSVGLGVFLIPRLHELPERGHPRC